ncbi:hypothetical protein ID866_12889 [Astraeus odoratus]|nr:hypothetical protein ID866_12889 [Astraeus odoratus]
MVSPNTKSLKFLTPRVPMRRLLGY